MERAFETDRFELVKSDRVQIADYQFNYNQRGALDVWIDSNSHGKRFLHQLNVEGSKAALHTGIYTDDCYILREKSSGNYFFLDINKSGIWLFNDKFFGAENYSTDDTTRVQQWITSAGN